MRCSSLLEPLTGSNKFSLTYLLPFFSGNSIKTRVPSSPTRYFDRTRTKADKVPFAIRNPCQTLNQSRPQWWGWCLEQSSPSNEISRGSMQWYDGYWWVNVPFKCTMLQKLSKCEVKAWLFWNLIMLQSFRFYMKSNFGEFKRSKNVTFGNSRGSEFCF